MAKEETYNLWDKIKANSYLPLYGNTIYYFHNIEMANKITKEGRKIIKKYKKIYENLF